MIWHSTRVHERISSIFITHFMFWQHKRQKIMTHFINEKKSYVYDTNYTTLWMNLTAVFHIFWHTRNLKHEYFRLHIIKFKRQCR